MTLINAVLRITFVVVMLALAYMVTTPVASTAPAVATADVVLDGQGWRCTGPVDIGLVKVSRPSGDAITFGTGCTGRIGRIEVDTWTADGVKVSNASSNAAHDIQVGSGYVKCWAIAGDTHQDALQAMGGARITFVNVEWDCKGNSNFFVKRGGGGATTPTDIVCIGCWFAAKSATSVRVESSLRSGTRDSRACVGRRVRQAFLFTSAAVQPVNVGNAVLAASNPFCAR